MPHPTPLILVAVIAAAGCQKKVVEAFPETFVGVGVELTMKDDAAEVVRVLPGGSAGEAGVLPGDRVTAVDGVATRNKKLGDVVMAIRGRPGTQVTLAVSRQQERLLIVVRRRGMSKTGNDYSRN